MRPTQITVHPKGYQRRDARASRDVEGGGKGEISANGPSTQGKKINSKFGRGQSQGSEEDVHKVSIKNGKTR